MDYDPSKTAAYLQGRIDEYVKFSARDTIMRNVKNDRHARYARIPDGGACDFCIMLGSRGFVYHSEDKAGGDRFHGTSMDSYHPFCNCQIAVCFDPYMDEYRKNGTKVRRGYGDGQVTVSGRDGSDELRNVDIDELFERYKSMTADFGSGSSKYRDYSRAGFLTPEAMDKARKLLEDATTMDELEAADAEIMRMWRPGSHVGRNQSQWDELSALAKERRTMLKSSVSVETDEIVPCLRRLSDGKIVQTEVERITRKEASRYKEADGWYIDWGHVPDNVEIYKLTVAGEDEAQGLVGIVDDPGNEAMYMHWAVSAPHNQSSAVGMENKVYDGVGGHLFSIAANQSVEQGYNGFTRGKAVNEQVLEYYEKEFGVIRIGRTLAFYLDEDSAATLMGKYTWTKKKSDT